MISAVRLGDLLKFNKVLDKYAKRAFEPDETLTLIVRLRQNVIKTALRQISTAYSCISIHDIGRKLLLHSDYEAEYLVAKVHFKFYLEIFISNAAVLLETLKRLLNVLF